MKKEEGWVMYIDIKQLKEKGFSKSKIAEMLGISRLFLLPIFVQKHTGNFVHDMPNIVSKTCWGKPQGFNAHVFQGE